MRVWRICRKPYVDTALDGIGGIDTSGRCHTKEHPIVYTATSAALAALEVLVHVDPLTLPEGWHSVPAPASLQSLGSSWLTSGRTAAVNVPSAIITVERNVLLNPRHPEAQRIRNTSDAAFTFDPRLLWRGPPTPPST